VLRTLHLADAQQKSCPLGRLPLWGRETVVAYRNKTFVSFASEDLARYRLMTAWRANERIDFNFHDAHDLNTALDSSQPETIRRRLRERLSNTKQVVMLVSDHTRAKAGQSWTFFSYEVDVIRRLQLPVVFANVNGSRVVQSYRLPEALSGMYSISVSFQPAIIKFALDDYPEIFRRNLTTRERVGPHYYTDDVYRGLGL
jgi:hypothetical protein